jgi:hypothetical protein
VERVFAQGALVLDLANWGWWRYSGIGTDGLHYRTYTGLPSNLFHDHGKYRRVRNSEGARCDIGLYSAVIVAQAIMAGLVGYFLGVLITIPMIHDTKPHIPWISLRWWLPLGVFFPTLAMCALASILSVKAALTVEPAKVFRA